MLNFVCTPVGFEDKDEPWMFVAEEQRWDELTINQLRDEYKIVFGTFGKGVLPVMFDECGMIILGIADDGALYFPRHSGSFIFRFHQDWVVPFISDLKEAYRLSIVNTYGDKRS